MAFGSFPLALCALALAAAHSGAFAAEQEDPGESLYRLGVKLLEEGKTDQAAARFEESARTAPASPFADDALLALGRITWPVDDTASLGTTGPKKLQAAAAIFEQVRTRYRSSNSAPAAEYRLGLIAMDPVNPKANLDEAWSHFTSVTELAPADPVALSAAIAAARVEAQQGRAGKALADLLRFTETSHSEAGPDAATPEASTPAGAPAQAGRLSWELADLYDRAGDPLRAIEEFQRLREDAPASPPAADALARAALLWRTKLLLPGKIAGVRASWKPDAAFAQAAAAAGLTGPRAVEADAAGRLFVADEKAGAVVEIDPSGKAVSRRAFERVLYVAPAPAGGELRAASVRAVGRPGELAATPAAGEREDDRVRKIGGLAARTGGGLLVLDKGSSVIHRYGAGMEWMGAFYHPAAGELTGLAAGPDGEVWVGLDPSLEIVRLDSTGRETARARGPGKGFGEITALAVDAAGSVYVLDARSRVVRLFDRSGAPLGEVDLAPLGELEPESLAVDPSGRIVLADRKGARLVRLS